MEQEEAVAGAAGAADVGAASFGRRAEVLVGQAGDDLSARASARPGLVQGAGAVGRLVGVAVEAGGDGRVGDCSWNLEGIRGQEGLGAWACEGLEGFQHSGIQPDDVAGGLDLALSHCARPCLLGEFCGNVRELLYGAKRYSVLRSGVPQASPTVLSQRLRDLEESEGDSPAQARPIGACMGLRTHASSKPMLVFLGRWGRRSPGRGTMIPLGVDSVMLALQSHLDPAQLDGLDTTVTVDLFTLRVGGGELVIQRGEPTH